MKPVGKSNPVMQRQQMKKEERGVAKGVLRGTSSEKEADRHGATRPVHVGPSPSVIVNAASSPMCNSVGRAGNANLLSAPASSFPLDRAAHEVGMEVNTSKKVSSEVEVSSFCPSEFRHCGYTGSNPGVEVVGRADPDRDDLPDELGDGKVTSDGKLVGANGTVLRRKKWKSDRELREERAASVGVKQNGSALSKSARLRSLARRTFAKGATVGMWDTGCEYNMLDEVTAAKWDGGRFRDLLISGFDKSTQKGKGGDDLVSLLVDRDGEYIVQNLGPAFGVRGLACNLWAGIGARDSQGVGTNIPSDDEDVLRTREGRVIPLEEDAGGARVRNLRMIVMPTALSEFVANGTRLVDVDWSKAPGGLKRRVKQALQDAPDMQRLQRAMRRRARRRKNGRPAAVMTVRTGAARRALGLVDGCGSEELHNVVPGTHGRAGIGDDAPPSGKRAVRWGGDGDNTYALVNVQSTKSPLVHLSAAQYAHWRAVWDDGTPRSQGAAVTRRLPCRAVWRRTLAKKRVRSAKDAQTAYAVGRDCADKARRRLVKEGFAVRRAPGESLSAAAVAMLGGEVRARLLDEDVDGAQAAEADEDAAQAPLEKKKTKSKKKKSKKEEPRDEAKSTKKKLRRAEAEAELERRRRRRRKREGLDGPPKAEMEDREERLRFMRLQHLVSGHGATLLNQRYDAGEFGGAGIRVKPEDLGGCGGCHSCGYSKTRKRRKKKKLPRRVPNRAFFDTSTDIYYIGREAHRLNRKGYKYVLGFMCRSTGYSFRYFMKDKKVSSILRGFRAFESKLESMAPYVERELGYCPRLNTLVSDVEGGETSTWAYSRSPFDAEMVLKNVRRRFTGADHPEGNGKIERSWRTMDENASHNLSESGLSEAFYCDAVAHHTVHHNCLPTSTNKIGEGKPPAQYLGLPEYKPEQLAPFGAMAWVPVGKQKEKVDGGEVHRGKRRRRGQACVLLGYGSDTEGFRVFDLHKQRVKTTPHAGVVPGLGGVRDLVTSIRADPSRVAKHASWVWRLYRFEPRAVLREERIRKDDRVLDWIDPVTLTPEFQAPGAIDGGGLVREASGGKRVEHEEQSGADVLKPEVRSRSRTGEPPAEVRESHPNSEPIIPLNSKELVGTDVNDQSREHLQPHKLEKKKKKKSATSVGAGGKRRSTDESQKKAAEKTEKERVRRLIRYARLNADKYRLEYDQDMNKRSGSMSDERYQQYKSCTSFEEVDDACITPIVYSSNGKSDKMMRQADLEYDLLHGYLQIVDEEGVVLSDAVAARAGQMVPRPSELPVTFGMCTAKGVAQARRARVAVVESDKARLAARAEQKEVEEKKWAAAVRRLVDEGVIEELYPNEQHRLEERELSEATEAWCKSVGAVESSRPSAISGCMPSWLVMALKAKVRIEVDGMIEPISLREAISMPEWPLWQKAVEKEIQGLIADDVWDEIPRSEVPAGRRVVPTHFVLKIKTEEKKDPETGESKLAFVKCKARLCFGGNRSVAGMDYHETASFVASAKSVRTMLALAAPRDYQVVSWDIARAFTIALIEDDMDLFMELPPLLGSNGRLNPLEYSGCGRGKCKSHVGKLKHMLYGSKDAPRKFAEVMIKFMNSIGAKAIITDQMVFRWEWQGHEMNICLHVDDIVATPSSDSIKEEFDRQLKKFFGEDRVTGGDETDAVLGMGITRDWEKKTITISQGGFARKFLTDFGVTVGAGRRVDAPLPSGCKLGKYDGEAAAEIIEWFRRFSGCLQWMAGSTRPDLSYAAALLSRFASNPGPAHVEAAKHVLAYIAWHPDLGITYHGSNEVLMQGYDHRDRLIGSVDADLGGCLDSEKSTSGYVFWLNGGAVAWKSKRQGVCSNSTTMSETLAANLCSMENAWLRDLCAELGSPQGCIRIMEDNSGCVALAHGQKDTARSSHYRRALALVVGEVARGSMWLDDVEGIHNPADIFTKSVEPSAHFGYLRDVIMGINPTLYLSVGVLELLSAGDTDQGNKLLTQSISQGHAINAQPSGLDGLPIT